MCGRYSFTTPLEAIRRLFRFQGSPNLAPRYNIAPTQQAPVLRRPTPAGGIATLDLLRWGLVPGWAKDHSIGARMINARAESVADKPAFRAAFRRRRCLVLSDGFYEWQAVDGGKQPYRVALAGDAPFAMAGLWETWHSPQGETIETFAIVTTAASAAIRAIHERMPVILPTALHDAWLDVERPADGAWLRPYTGSDLRAYPIGRHVNAVRNDDPTCWVPLAAEPRQASLL
ncbi:MAG: SOS response-associated peptidase [Alphaproteobacteria bacterium]|nr:SOS response-associated peptidase [Alphaproteobacteria bacterium]